MEVNNRDNEGGGGDQNQDPNPNPNPSKPETTGFKGKSCKGALYFSSVQKSKSENPTCVGITRTLPRGMSTSVFAASFIFFSLSWRLDARWAQKWMEEIFHTCFFDDARNVLVFVDDYVMFLSSHKEKWRRIESLSLQLNLASLVRGRSSCDISGWLRIIYLA